MGTDPLTHTPVLLQDRHAACFHNAPHTIVAAQAMLGLVEGFSRDSVLPRIFSPCAVLRMDCIEKAETGCLVGSLASKPRPFRGDLPELTLRRCRPDDG